MKLLFILLLSIVLFSNAKASSGDYDSFMRNSATSHFISDNTVTKEKKIKRKNKSFIHQTQSKYDLPITINKDVKNWIKFYLRGRGKGSLKTYLKRLRAHGPIIEKTLKESNLPQNLIYVSVAESGLNFKAVSPKKAQGAWQIIPSTARKLGLKGKDVFSLEKSTNAAAAHLGYLFEKYGSWELALSAYNMGERRLDRLLNKYQEKDFWILKEKKGFPKETRDYVPRIVALVILSQNLLL